MRELSATSHAISLPNFKPRPLSIDICFDSKRVWSIDLRDYPAETLEITWPAQLQPYLIGHTTLEVRDSSSQQLLATAEIAFTNAQKRVSVTDEQGEILAINKWGRLARTLTRQNTDLSNRILAQTSEIIDFLRSLGKNPFIVGGTLLGAVRDGALLPYDDDADIAYLSEHTNPTDVAIEGLKLSRSLTAAGYTVEQHSAAHMQLYFNDDAGNPSHYIDVFAAFFDADGNINQPFHVRGPMHKKQLLPLDSIDIAGHSLPIPRDINAWLTLNYNAQWRTPIPGFKLQTPEPTRKRFAAWFGTFHDNYDFWQDYHSNLGMADDATWSLGRAWLKAQQDNLTSPVLLELGSGTGNLASQLQADNRRVIASDFVPSSQASCQERGLEYANINLHRLSALTVPFKKLDIDGAFDVVLNHTLGCLPPHSIEIALRLCRIALRSGGSVFLTEWATQGDESEGYPRFGAISQKDLLATARKLGLKVSFVTMKNSDESLPDRKPYGAQLTLADNSKLLSIRDRYMFKNLKALVRKILRFMKSTPDNTTPQELDELRRDHIRVAELVDLLETELSSKPSAKQ